MLIPFTLQPVRLPFFAGSFGQQASMSWNEVYQRLCPQMVYFVTTVTTTLTEFYFFLLRITCFCIHEYKIELIWTNMQSQITYMAYCRREVD